MTKWQPDEIVALLDNLHTQWCALDWRDKFCGEAAPPPFGRYLIDRLKKVGVVIMADKK